ncbi:dopa decarboxylase [Trichuris trichiura]|uniref:Aromatic-L-amino-acid decarboxylase n=1 Tax=Trichuris trichiura TaxID=36087 RepID=A0A077Z312_TRITR|nr:dopa decarboxylase [Trichuris trichiura]
MEPEELRKWGKLMIDYVADYWTTLPSRKPCPEVSPGYIRQLVPEDAPEKGDSWENIFADLENAIMKGVTHWHHPHFFSYFPTGNSYPSIIGDILSDGIGALGFTWASSPAYTELEMAMMDWLAKMIGLPEIFLFTHNGPGGGVIQGSASEGVHLSMSAARKLALKNLTEEQNSSNLIAYASEQAHSSVERAAMLNLVKFHPVKSDDLCRMTAGALEEAIQKDKEAGLIPFFVCVTLGTTASCAVDCLPEIGPLCNSHGIWLHVDAAYGGSAAICPEYRWIMEGVEHADTITHNPHKALMVNFDCSAFWMKNCNNIEQAFSVNPEYLAHKKQGLVPDFMNYQVSLGRRFRALKLWFTVRVYGVEGLRKNFRKFCTVAQYFAGLVRKDPRFEIVQPVVFGVVCIRLKVSYLKTNWSYLRVYH